VRAVHRRVGQVQVRERPAEEDRGVARHVDELQRVREHRVGLAAAGGAAVERLELLEGHEVALLAPRLVRTPFGPPLERLLVRGEPLAELVELRAQRRTMFPPIGVALAPTKNTRPARLRRFFVSLHFFGIVRIFVSS
jgi:hypothetical protein